MENDVPPRDATGAQRHALIDGMVPNFVGSMSRMTPTKVEHVTSIQHVRCDVPTAVQPDTFQFQIAQSVVWNVCVCIELPARSDGSLWPRDVTIGLLDDIEVINGTFGLWSARGDVNAVLAAHKRSPCDACASLVLWSREVRVPLLQMFPRLVVHEILGHVWRTRTACACYGSLPRAVRRLISAHPWTIAMPIMGAFHRHPLMRGTQQGPLRVLVKSRLVAAPSDTIDGSMPTNAKLADPGDVAPRPAVEPLDPWLRDAQIRAVTCTGGEPKPDHRDAFHRATRLALLTSSQDESDVIHPCDRTVVTLDMSACLCATSVLIVCEPILARTKGTCADDDFGALHLFDEATFRFPGLPDSFRAERMERVPFAHAYVVRWCHPSARDASTFDPFPELDGWQIEQCASFVNTPGGLRATLAFRGVGVPFRMSAHAWDGNVHNCQDQLSVYQFF